MPDWIWMLIVADLIAAMVLALVIALLSQRGRFWPSLIRAAILLGLTFVVGSFLLYFGGWLVIRGIRGG